MELDTKLIKSMVTRLSSKTHKTGQERLAESLLILALDCFHNPEDDLEHSDNQIETILCDIQKLVGNKQP